MQQTYQFPPNQQQQQHQFPVQQQYPFQQQPTVQHVVVLQIPMENHPIHTTCPACHSSIVTKVTLETNASTHFLAGILCIMCCIPCACLPYFCDTTKSSVHTCSNCNAYIGTFNPGRRYNRW